MISMSESHKVTYGFILEDRPSTVPGVDYLRPVRVADLNGDGLDDLVVVRHVTTEDPDEVPLLPQLPVDDLIYVLESTGFGFKKAQITSDFLDIEYPRHNNVIDLDGDGLLDVVFFNHGNVAPDLGGFDAYRSYPYVLWNNGSEGYRLVKLSQTTADWHGGMAADIDDDGFGDFVALAENDVSESILVRGSPDRTFTEQPLLDAISGEYRSDYGGSNNGTLSSIGSLTDLVGSELPDLVIAFRTFTDAYVHIFENIDGEFTGPRYEFPMLSYDEFLQNYDVLYQYGSPKGYLTTWERISGDVDADGDDEIFFVQEAHSSAAVYGFDKQNGLPVEIGTSMFPEELMKKIHEDGTHWSPLGFNDLNGDGFPDFVGSTYQGDSDRRLYFQDTTEYHQILLQSDDATFYAPAASDYISLIQRDTGGVRAVDVNGDGTYELVGLHNVRLDSDQQTLRTRGPFSLTETDIGVTIFWEDSSVNETDNQQLIQQFTTLQAASGMDDRTNGDYETYFRDGPDGSSGLRTVTPTFDNLIVTGGNESTAAVPWPDQVVAGDYDFGNFRVVFGGDAQLNQSIQVLTAVLGEEAASNYAFRGVAKRLFEQGQSMEQVCDAALAYAGLETAQDVVSQLYRNLYGDDPTDEQAQPFIEMIDDGIFTQGSFAAAAANLTDDLGLVDLVGLADSGIGYV